MIYRDGCGGGGDFLCSLIHYYTIIIICIVQPYVYSMNPTAPAAVAVDGMRRQQPRRHQQLWSMAPGDGVRNGTKGTHWLKSYCYFYLPKIFGLTRWIYFLPALYTRRARRRARAGAGTWKSSGLCETGTVIFFCLILYYIILGRRNTHKSRYFRFIDIILHRREGGGWRISRFAIHL